MAVLTDAKRREIWSDIMRAMSNNREQTALTKADILAAVAALDDFMNANAAAINNAIPQPARGALTTAQKARLLQIVVQARYIEGA